ncbi:mast cell tryptase isoform X2 [Lepeophtheirus salmonis]|uniref:mast cell tryptase isoform X2 n=1 Tax=Lepeophtheirus salmonis TaxID=72036 RepID=UPI001AE3A464|nr:clotting factor B-like isoform X2 [Lepeophtheirus salmonis]
MRHKDIPSFQYTFLLINCSIIMFYQITTLFIGIILISDIVNANRIVSCKCGISNKKSTKIINNDQKYERNEFPWLIRIFSKEIYGKEGIKESGLCAGSIINKNSSSGLQGSTTSNWCEALQKGQESILEVEDLIFHPDSKKTIGQENVADLALIKFKNEFIFTSNSFNPICLPHVMNLYNDTNATVVGWGTTQVNKINSTCVLLSANLKTIPIERKICRIATSLETRNFINSTTAKVPILCSYKEMKHKKTDYGLNAVQDACLGDSGGPLMTMDFIPGKWTKRLTLIGIVSYGRSCAEYHVPGIYTRITAYLNWIVSNIQEGECKAYEKSNYAWNTSMGELNYESIRQNYSYLSAWEGAPNSLTM